MEEFDDVKMPYRISSFGFITFPLFNSVNMVGKKRMSFNEELGERGEIIFIFFSKVISYASL